MSECYFTESHGFGPIDKHGYHYMTTECGCGDHPNSGKLDLAGKNYLYRNDKGQTVIGYHAVMDDGEEHPIYNKKESYFDHLLNTALGKAYYWASDFCINKSVLEIGCGDLGGAELLLRKTPVKKYYAIDYNINTLIYFIRNLN